MNREQTPPDRPDESAPPDGAQPPGPLERHVEVGRRFWRRSPSPAFLACGAALGLAAGSGALLWLSARPPGAAPLGATLSDPLEVPTALAASDDDVGLAIEGALEGDGGVRWRGVAAAPDGYGVVAVWSDHELWVSRDDGRAFHQELAAPEAIGAVAVGEGARVYTARHGGRFGVLTPGGNTEWSTLGFDQALAMAAGGRRVAILALSADRADGFAPLLWLSADYGQSFTRLVAPVHGDIDNQLRITPEGDIDLLAKVDADVVERIVHYRGHVDGRVFEQMSSRDQPVPFGLTHEGESLYYAWSSGPDGVVKLASYDYTVRDWSGVIGRGPDRTFVAVDDQLLVLGARLEVASPTLPIAPTALVGDVLGRAAAIRGSALVRYSPRHGWRLLLRGRSL